MESAKLSHWSVVFELGLEGQPGHRFTVREAPTFDAAKRMITTVVTALGSSGVLSTPSARLVLDGLERATLPRSMLLGGFAVASYTPPWRFAILPEPAMGYTAEEAMQVS